VSERRRVAVLGGGVAGLAAAHRLTELAPEVDVVLVEARERLGGTIETERSGGFTIEGGAESMIAEKPWALALCERLGFTPRLIGTREGERRTFVVRAGRLEPLPEGFLLLAPTSLAPLVRSRIFSWPGKLRMALDLVIPRGRGGDESLAAFVRRRLGREALERVAQPLVGGIYTADPERLSLAATMPRFLEIERRHRSLILGLRRGATARGEAGARYSLFVAPDEGMGAFVAAIASRLPEGAVRLRAPVPGLARVGDRWRLTAGGEPITADALVVATPAHVAATLLGAHDAPLGSALAEIDYASSATVTLGYRAPDLPPLQGFGFVVPAIERRSLLACTYSSRKFAGRAPEGHDLVRGFVGGALRPDLAGLADDALVGLVRDELRTLVGITASPELVRVRRYPRAMPQYDVGHLDRVAAIERRAALLPRVVLAGAAYRGVGVPDCVRSGEAAAEAVLRDLKREPGASP
jgi:oxygen-dependent protoporphyrinogen oxidase